MDNLSQNDINVLSQAVQQGVTAGMQQAAQSPMYGLNAPHPSMVPGGYNQPTLGTSLTSLGAQLFGPQGTLPFVGQNAQHIGAIIEQSRIGMASSMLGDVNPVTSAFADIWGNAGGAIAGTMGLGQKEQELINAAIGGAFNTPVLGNFLSQGFLSLPFAQDIMGGNWLAAGAAVSAQRGLFREQGTLIGTMNDYQKELLMAQANRFAETSIIATREDGGPLPDLGITRGFRIEDLNLAHLSLRRQGGPLADYDITAEDEAVRTQEVRKALGDTAEILDALRDVSAPGAGVNELLMRGQRMFANNMGKMEVDEVVQSIREIEAMAKEFNRIPSQIADSMANVQSVLRTGMGVTRGAYASTEVAMDVVSRGLIQARNAGASTPEEEQQYIQRSAAIQNVIDTSSLGTNLQHIAYLASQGFVDEGTYETALGAYRTGDESVIRNLTSSIYRATYGDANLGWEYSNDRNRMRYMREQTEGTRFAKDYVETSFQGALSEFNDIAIDEQIVGDIYNRGRGLLGRADVLSRDFNTRTSQQAIVRTISGLEDQDLRRILEQTLPGLREQFGDSNTSAIRSALIQQARNWSGDEQIEADLRRSFELETRRSQGEAILGMDPMDLASRSAFNTVLDSFGRGLTAEQRSDLRQINDPELRRQALVAQFGYGSAAVRTFDRISERESQNFAQLQEEARLGEFIMEEENHVDAQRDRMDLLKKATTGEISDAEFLSTLKQSSLSDSEKETLINLVNSGNRDRAEYVLRMGSLYGLRTISGASEGLGLSNYAEALGGLVSGKTTIEDYTSSYEQGAIAARAYASSETAERMRRTPPQLAMALAMGADFSALLPHITDPDQREALEKILGGIIEDITKYVKDSEKEVETATEKQLEEETYASSRGVIPDRDLDSDSEKSDVKKGKKSGDNKKEQEPVVFRFEDLVMTVIDATKSLLSGALVVDVNDIPESGTGTKMVQ